jgi:hypothetical protein
MKGVKNKLAQSATSGLNKPPQAGEKDKTRKKSMTAGELVAINHRLDQCLPLETPEWQRVEQLLMQMSEFAPRLLVYEVGMAVALYADDQSRRAYILGAADAKAQEAAKDAANYAPARHGRARGLASA